MKLIALTATTTTSTVSRTEVTGSSTSTPPMGSHTIAIPCSAMTAPARACPANFVGASRP